MASAEEALTILLEITMICEICGHESEIDVWERPDGIRRCKLCASRAVYGRVSFPSREILELPLAELKRRNEQWEHHPINREIR